MSTTSPSTSGGAAANVFEFEPVTHCMLCGDTRQHDAKGVSWLGVGFSYCICGGCGLKYMRPRPTADSYARFYRDQYWDQLLTASGFGTIEGGNDASRDQMALRMDKYRRGYEEIVRDLGAALPLDASLRVLEVGAGFGYAMEWLARDYGCRTFAVEPSSIAAERCRSVGVEVLAETAEAMFVADPPAAAAESPFDVILLKQCLANLVDPIAVLRGMRRRLSPRGVLLIYTLNVNFHDQPAPYYPFQFNPSTLRRLLEKTGFEVRRLSATPAVTSRREAVRILRADYQIIALAAPGAERDVPSPPIDPEAIARQIAWGKKVVAWNELSVRELLQRVFRKVGHRLFPR